MPKKKVATVKKGFIYKNLFWSVMKPDQAEKTIFCDMDESTDGDEMKQSNSMISKMFLISLFCFDMDE